LQRIVVAEPRNPCKAWAKRRVNLAAAWLKTPDNYWCKPKIPRDHHVCPRFQHLHGARATAKLGDVG
jgi:hypothetical protein